VCLLLQDLVQSAATLETVTVSLGRGSHRFVFCRKERTTGGGWVGGWLLGMQNLFDFAACCSPFKATPLDLEKASPAGGHLLTLCVLLCVFYYCSTYYKAVRVGGGGEWRTCAMSVCVYYCRT
jgi:hypothetical protein